jgi:hypothetical protein
MRRLLQLQSLPRFGHIAATKGKAEVLYMDDFERYLQFKRDEMRVSPHLFWVDFLIAIGFIAAGVGFMVAFVCAAPVIAAFLRVGGV